MDSTTPSKDIIWQAGSKKKIGLSVVIGDPPN
jgi:hypothetical protein